MSRTTDKTQETPRRNNGELPLRAQPSSDDPFERIIACLDTLNALWGHDSEPKDSYATGEPLDGLMLTLLSQNTNDKNRDVAYAALRAVYPTWHDVALAPVGNVSARIRPAGIGVVKAERMQMILQQIYARFGDYSLKTLFDWQPSAVEEFLLLLPGIGHKTAACVMVFDLMIPAFPVDTHVARVSRRLAWVPANWIPERIQDFLEGIIPEERKRGGHLNMIDHGRNICVARSPKCSACALSALCKYAADQEERC